MSHTDFSITLLTAKSPAEVFTAINDIRGWWSEDFTGHSVNLQDEFTVRFGDMHFSRQRIMDIIPDKKIEWLVTESTLSFLQIKDEWTGTKVLFEIVPVDNATEIRFTHTGLVPEIECYKDCTKGWNYYLQNSLLPFINTGAGVPNRKKE